MLEKREKGKHSRIGKLNPQVSKAIIRAVRAGVSYVKAAEALGISPTTVNHWRNRGKREERGLYHDFYVGCQRAAARLQAELIDRMMHLAQGNTKKRPLLRVVDHTRYIDGKMVTEQRVEYVGMDRQAIQWLLENKWYNEFGTKRIEHKGKVDTGGDSTQRFEVVIVDPD